MYNDIFVDNEYDYPIQTALLHPPTGRTLNVLDIGANVGFFTLRFIDLVRQSKGAGLPFQITSIEGSPTVVKELSTRLLEENDLVETVRVVHGLVGQRNGSAEIAEYDFHAMNTIMFSHDSGGVIVNFIDIETLLGDDKVIDLLKCDIEGAELSFLENYGDYMGHVTAAVFELHHDRCDTEKCMRILYDLGFIEQTTLRDTATFSVRYFSR
ncbi:MAG TPA: FkbM family methyltransferase [Pyrinomonadaceae bacterium]|nr:FkbM family methyltransferase [Pyrinomonadaceae bacterium]